MDGPAYVRALVDRGYSPAQAAALVGHIIQESGGNPAAFNKNEDAHGLLQWRLDRWDNLRKFAAERGVSPHDRDLQLDYIGREMSGPEAKSSAAFRSAADIPSASTALKRYIRFGDTSDQTRLNHALALAGQQPAAAAPAMSASAGVPAAAPVGAGAGGSTVSAVTPAAAGPVAALAALPQLLGKQQAADTPPPLTLQPAEVMVTPQMQRARQLAQAMLSRALNPETPT